MSEEVKAQFFKTVTDMRTVPADKIDHFCEDLRLWLHMHKQVEELHAQLGELAYMVKIKTPIDAFGWVDDNKHDATIKVQFSADASVEETTDGQPARTTTA